MPLNVFTQETLQQTIFERSTVLDEKWSICVFETSLRGLGATYAVQLRLIGKIVVHFLLVIIEFFSLGVTAEVLRAKIDWKSPFL